jgi:hypothetical protein
MHFLFDIINGDGILWDKTEELLTGVASEMQVDKNHTWEGELM